MIYYRCNHSQFMFLTIRYPQVGIALPISVVSKTCFYGCFLEIVADGDPHRPDCR